MDIFINERSFDGSAPPHDVRDLLREFYRVLDMLRQKVYPGAEVITHQSFKTCLITQEQTVISWLSRENRPTQGGGQASGEMHGNILAHASDQTSDDMLVEDQSDQPSLQPLVTLLLSTFSQSPDVEELVGTHLCDFEQVEHNGTMLAAAAGTRGVLTSLGKHPIYQDGELSVEFMDADGNITNVDVPHFVTVAEVRKRRRRYVPNRKHHPDRPLGDGTPMEMDREYDKYTDAQRQSRRAVDCDPFDTCVQWLLDRAIPYGKQLYNLTYTRNGKPDTFYKFMSEEPNVFHGFPISANYFPDEVMQQIQERLRKSA